MTTSNETPIAAGASTQDALALLKADHEAVETLLQQYEQLGSDRLPADRSGLASSVCGQLTAHAAIEEELFYPALRGAGGAAIGEALREHAKVKQLIADISAAQPTDASFDANMKQLAASVRHHVAEEEGKIFELARSSGVDLAALGERMALRKAQVMPNQAPD